MTLSEIFGGVKDYLSMPTPKYVNGMDVPYSGDQSDWGTMGLNRKIVRGWDGMSPDFKAVAPLKDYVPQWRRDKDAKDAVWAEYGRRLNLSDLLKGE